MIENRGKYFKNTSSFPLPKIPLVDSSKPASVDQMWNMFAVNITIKVNHVISIENWTYRRHARGFGIVELEKIARGFRCYPNEITELLTLHACTKYKAIDLHEITTWWTTKKVFREEYLLKTAEK